MEESLEDTWEIKVLCESTYYWPKTFRIHFIQKIYKVHFIQNICKLALFLNRDYTSKIKVLCEWKCCMATAGIIFHFQPCEALQRQKLHPLYRQASATLSQKYWHFSHFADKFCKYLQTNIDKIYSQTSPKSPCDWAPPWTLTTCEQVFDDGDNDDADVFPNIDGCDDANIGGHLVVTTIMTTTTCAQGTTSTLNATSGQTQSPTSWYGSIM